LTSKNALYTELLVMRCQRGERDAMEELVRLWEQPLYYYVRRLLADEDVSRQVMQDAWVKVIKGIGRLREPKSFVPWAYTIVRMTAMDHMRHKYARPVQPMDDEFDVADDWEDESIAAESAEQVHRALGQLSLQHREVLTLFFLQDLSLAEIAAMLEISEGTVKSRLHYAKKEMKKAIGNRQ
jgi:RNA polymerase sigma-70 factor, ECF subfamily